MSIIIFLLCLWFAYSVVFAAALVVAAHRADQLLKKLSAGGKTKT